MPGKPEELEIIEPKWTKSGLIGTNLYFVVSHEFRLIRDIGQQNQPGGLF
jgi:hypothetical protein